MFTSILVAIVTSTIRAVEGSRATGKPREPFLRVLLNEVSNCAALHPARPPIVQIRTRYGDLADARIGASTCKLVLESIDDSIKPTR